MPVLFEGKGLNGKPIDGEFGLDTQGRQLVRWTMEVTDGDHAGKHANYSGKLDRDNIKWTKRDMMSIGWKGQDVRTFVTDVEAAKLTVPFDAEIASHNG